MPSSNAVTTLQIVRTIKRGENGSINVSMGPLEADCAALFAWPDASLIQNAAQALHDIRHAGHGYDTRSRCEATKPCARLDDRRPGLFAVQRNGRTFGRSVAVRPHLAGNVALLHAVLRQPGIGSLDCAIDMGAAC